MSFLQHLEVMRWHLVRSIAAIVILALVAFVFKDIVFDKIILAPKEPPFPTNRWLCQLSEILGINRLCINSDPFSLQTVKMAEQFSMHIIVSLIAGIVLAFPYIFWEFWRFIIPALYEKEKKTAHGAVFFTSLLFLLGVTCSNLGRQTKDNPKSIFVNRLKASHSFQQLRDREVPFP